MPTELSVRARSLRKYIHMQEERQGRCERFSGGGEDRKLTHTLYLINFVRFHLIPPGYSRQNNNNNNILKILCKEFFSIFDIVDSLLIFD